MTSKESIEALNHIADPGKKVSSSCGQENDMVYRRAAIDIVRNECRCGEQAELIEEFEALPSAQPEIIRCKDCKYYVKDRGWNCIEYTVCSISQLHHPLRKPNDFCSRAERREE